MIRCIALLALFCIDVRVKAETEVTVYAAHSMRNFEHGGVRGRMSSGSLIEVRGGAIHVTRGEFLFEFKNSAAVHAPYASIACRVESCHALVRRDSNRIVVKALKGDFAVSRLGDQSSYLLFAGSQTEVAEVRPDGKAEMDFPQSLPWTETVREWARLFPGTAKEFKATLVEFREEWRRAVERLSLLHAERAGRTIASHESALAEAESRRTAREREDAAYRKMFREKNFIDVGP